MCRRSLASESRKEELNQGPRTTVRMKWSKVVSRAQLERTPSGGFPHAGPALSKAGTRHRFQLPAIERLRVFLFDESADFQRVGLYNAQSRAGGSISQFL
jgi:hypothetical protein